MRKKNLAPKIHLLVLTTIISLSLFGCGNSQAESTPATAASEQEPAVAEETTIEETSTEIVDDVQEETAGAEEEDQETATETEESAEVEEVAEDPGEVEYITGYLTIFEYTKNLDPSKLCILIYNETDGYIIDMKEGQHYQLKKGDKIYSLFENGSIVGYGFNFEIVKSIVGPENEPEQEYEIDYSKMTENQEFFIKRKLDSGEFVQLTVYLDPPTE